MDVDGGPGRGGGPSGWAGASGAPQKYAPRDFAAKMDENASTIANSSCSLVKTERVVKNSPPRQLADGMVQQVGLAACTYCAIDPF